MTIERLNGDGTLSISNDGGATWTDCRCEACCSVRAKTAVGNALGSGGIVGGFSAALGSSSGGLGSIDAFTVFGSGNLIGAVAQAPMPALTPADIQHAATEGRNTERDRILARLNAIKPGECSYTRLQSEWERKGAMRMWERCMEAIVDGKEAHKDRDAQ